MNQNSIQFVVYFWTLERKWLSWNHQLLKWLYVIFGDFTYLQSLDTPEKNCNISCRPKILFSWFFCCCWSRRNWRHSRNLLIAKTHSYRRTENKQKFSKLWRVCILRHSVDVTSVNFNSEKIHEDNIFGRQDISQFFSGVSKDYKYVKFPNTR